MHEWCNVCVCMHACINELGVQRVRIRIYTDQVQIDKNNHTKQNNVRKSVPRLNNVQISSVT